MGNLAKSSTLAMSLTAMGAAASALSLFAHAAAHVPTGRPNTLSFLQTGSLVICLDSYLPPPSSLASPVFVQCLSLPPCSTLSLPECLPSPVCLWGRHSHRAVSRPLSTFLLTFPHVTNLFPLPSLAQGKGKRPCLPSQSSLMPVAWGQPISAGVCAPRACSHR